MKKLLLVLFACLLMLACKDDPLIPNTSNSELVSKWDFLRASGGLAGGVILNQNEDLKSISFESNGTYKEYRNNKVTEKIGYTIIKGTSIRGAEKPVIHYNDDDRRFNQSFEIAGDTLILSDEIYDGFTHVYIKSQVTSQD